MYYYNPYVGSYYDDFSYERKQPILGQDEYFPVEEAFNKGNVLRHQYDQYRNYRPDMPKGHNEKETLLIMMMMYGAVCHDLVLLLDVNPRNQTAMSLFTQYDQKYKEIEQTYLSKYGTLNASNSQEKDGVFTYPMVKSPWETM